MRKIFIAAILAVSLGGCAELQKITGALTLATTGINNPVTPTHLYEAENGMIVALAALNAYRRSCIQALIPPSCRDTIARIQVYTRKMKPMLVRLRVFVKTNDQVNAIGTYNLVMQLISDFKAEAIRSGVPVGGV